MTDEMAKRKNPEEFDPMVTISETTRLAWIAQRGKRTTREIAASTHRAITHSAIVQIENGYRGQVKRSTYIALVRVLYGVPKATAEAQAAEALEQDRQLVERLAHASTRADPMLVESVLRVLEDNAKQQKR